jgi:hypothetical protein
MTTALVHPATPAVSNRADWERSIQVYGVCEATRDPMKPGASEKAFTTWAMKRRLPVVEGEHLVALDPKAFNPKDSLDRGRFAFLLRYARPRPETDLIADISAALAIRSQHLAHALKSYWLSAGVISSSNGMIIADPELLRLMGFTFRDLCHALDGIVQKQYLSIVTVRLEAVGAAVQMGGYVVDFDLVKERFFDAAFLLNAAGKPVPLSQLGAQMGVDQVDDVRAILREARKRFDLNVELNDTHAMFGPPSQQAVEALIGREREQKRQIEQTEKVLQERLRTITSMVDHYNRREAQILNENESLRDEGRTLWIKAKMVSAAKDQMAPKRGGR